MNPTRIPTYIMIGLKSHPQNLPFFLADSAVHPLNRTRLVLLSLFISPSVHLLFFLYTVYRPPLPLFPAKIVSASEDHKKAKDGEKDHRVSCHHQSARPPLNLWERKYSH